MNNMEMVEQLVALLERSSLAELEYRSADGWRIRLTRSAPTATRSPPATSTSMPTSDEVGGSSSDTSSMKKAGTHPTAAMPMTVKAGVAGLFCVSPSAEAPPFVSIGDVVEEGQTLAIIEAMKVLNAVEADRRGRIVRILAQDQSAVDAATPLFELEPLEGDHV